MLKDELQLTRGHLIVCVCVCVCVFSFSKNPTKHKMAGTMLAAIGANIPGMNKE
jgi:hypothetical protein